MNARYIIAIALLLASLNVANAQSFLSSYNVLQNWAPVIVAGVMLGFMIVAIEWAVGILLDNPRIKQGARSEFVQVLGTLIMLIIVIFVLSIFGSVIQGIVPPTTMMRICSTGTPSLINSNILIINPNEPNTASNVLCNNVISTAVRGTSSLTQSLDYGLASSYLVLANLTNQSASNLNATYEFESYIGFLRSFSAVSSICWPQETCWVPYGPRVFQLDFTYQPLAGYSTLTRFSNLFEVQANVLLYLYFIQLIFITIFLVMWPYLLAAGFILRTTFFTRRLGGLLIAVALGTLIIFPFIFMFEYASLSNPSTINPIGATHLPVITIYERSLDWSLGSSGVTTYNFNFYVLPKVNEVVNYYYCLPGPGGPQGGNLLTQEIAFASWYIVPLYSVGSIFGTGEGAGYISGLPTLPASGNYITNTPPSFPFYFGCLPENALKTAFALINVYGIQTVEGFLIPLFNVLITISGIAGLSLLFGGDTSIPGISKLL